MVWTSHRRDRPIRRPDFMPTTDEATVVAPAPTNAVPTSKMRQLLLRRLRQLLRATIALAICLTIAAMGLGIRWLTCLNGLPDIGEPFDVAAFRSFRVPDDQNAFAYLRQANAKLTPIRGEKGDHGTYPGGPKFSWSSASPSAAGACCGCSAQLPGACGSSRAAAKRAGCLGHVHIPDLDEPDPNGQNQRAALSRQSESTGGSSSATA